jgi:hypothetical protein
MKTAGSTYRLRMIMIIVLAAAMTLGSFWVLEVMRNPQIGCAPCDDSGLARTDDRSNHA